MRRAPLQSLRILGIMTGTSCDGLDAACLEIDLEGWKPLWSAGAAYPNALRKRVLQAQKPGFTQDTLTWLSLNRDLGEWYGTAVQKILKSQSNKDQPHALANHGQTIAHYPQKGVTLQMGDPTRLAQKTGLTTVASFREGDMASGGQGAPFGPRFHKLLVHHLSQSAGESSGIAIHNIGGISNLTYLGPGDEILAFDTGPGNVWIDAAAELATRGQIKMDLDGKLARLGTVDERAVKSIMRHPYFKRRPPKSTGRDEFPLELLLSETRAKGADLVATATALTVESIAQAYEKLISGRKLPLSQVFFCGGGAKNPSLMYAIQHRLPEISMKLLTESGFDGQLIEAQAFAYFGFLSLLGQPIGGTWTGAKSFGPPAHIIPGANWAEVMSILREIQSRK